MHHRVRGDTQSKKGEGSGGSVNDGEPSNTATSDCSEEDATSATADGSPSIAPEQPPPRRKHRIIFWSSLALLLAIVATTGLVAAARIEGPMPGPTVEADRLTTSVVPGPVPVPPWPARGQAAVDIPALGYAQQSGPEQPVPIASLTKMTTALVVLRDHPVPLGSLGSTVTITPDESAQWGVNVSNGETNIPLLPGETLTELQLLEALMVHSADDVAYTLAVWDAGSQQAFVAKMNAVAASLGALHSHYADASGFDPHSVSTAADTLRIAAAGMVIPTFALVAGMPAVNLPWAGVIANTVTAIGTNGIVGVKSGYTSQASGCMVLAAYRFVHGRSVLVLASALGQLEPPPTPPGSAPAPAPPGSPPAPPYSPLLAQYPLLYAEPIVEHLLDTSVAAIVPVPVVATGQTVGTASTAWGGAPVVAARGAWLLGVPGQQVAVTMTTSGTKSKGLSAGTVRITLGPQSETVPVQLLHRMPEPGWWWKVLHN
jgi:D-alanyl-D-alanine carboxypeptidase (penicillin-binding protein 5/6)